MKIKRERDQILTSGEIIRAAMNSGWTYDEAEAATIGVACENPDYE